MVGSIGEMQEDSSPIDRGAVTPRRPIRARAAYRNLSRTMRTLVVLLGIIIAPVAVPAWTLERVIRRWRPDFEFGTFSSTPYFVLVVLIATVGLIASPTNAIGFVSLYVLFILELVSLSVCATIAIISPGRLQVLNRTVARRTFSPQAVTANRTTIYSAIVSAGYAVFFYGAVSYVLWQGNHSFFGRVSAHSATPYIFWQFMQNSFLIITNAGPTLTPQRFLSELIRDVELIVGIFLLVFLLSVLASGWTERALKAARTSEQVERSNPSKEE